MMNRSLSQEPDSPIATAIYLYFGDEFLVKERISEFVFRVLDEKLRKTNLITLDGARLNVPDLFSLVFTQSLFGGPRIILVEQTVIFASRADAGKLSEKAAEAWKAGQSKTAFKIISQILSLLGVASEEIRKSGDWIDDVVAPCGPSVDKESFLVALQAFAAERMELSSRDEESLLEELLTSKLPDETFLVFSALAVDRRKRLFKTLEKNGGAVECSVREEKYGSGMEKSFFTRRVKEVLAKEGKTIARDALEMMYGLSGKELRRIQSELDKILAYVGDRKQVTAQDVALIYNDSHEGTIFDLTNALRAGNLAKSLSALHYNLRMAAHPLQMLGAITTEFRRLIAARDMLFGVFKDSWRAGMSYDEFIHLAARVRQDRPKKKSAAKFDLLSMKDYPLYLYLRDAQKFQMTNLMTIMDKLLQADTMMKSSRLGNAAPHIILEDLILAICNSMNRNSTPPAHDRR